VPTHTIRCGDAAKQDTMERVASQTPKVRLLPALVRGSLGLLVILLLVFLTRNAWLPWFGEYLVSATGPCKADIIVVLAGDFDGNRILAAGQLQRDGWAPVVLVSGADDCYGLNEGDLAIQFAVKHGYPASAFVNLTMSAHSTREEADYMVAELRRRGVHRFVLLTSDYHTHRSAGIYRETVPEIPFCVAAAPDPYFTAKTWWNNRESRKTVFFEWSKTIANFFHI
jgi:uncharacterized SAM-binding protein YcdF (DUF218 family)